VAITLRSAVTIVYFNFNLLLNLFSKDWYQVINNVFLFWSLAVFLDIPVICFIVLVEGRWGRRPLFAFLLFATGMQLVTLLPALLCLRTAFSPNNLFQIFLFPIVPNSEKDQIFCIYKEIQNGAVAKSYMRKGFLIY
jgi:hypothetical protein